MKDISNQYIAGLIDGEGYIALLPSKQPELHNKSFGPVVKLGMTGSISKMIMDVLYAKYGGHLEYRERSKKNPKWKDVHYWILKSRRKVKIFLDDIEPYLLIKKEQAVLLQEFCTLPSSHTKYGSFSQETVSRKEYIFNYLKELKRL